MAAIARSVRPGWTIVGQIQPKVNERKHGAIMAAVEVDSGRRYDRTRVDLDAYGLDCWRTLLEAVERHRPPLNVRLNAACRGMDTSLWFPESSVPPDAATSR